MDVGTEGASGLRGAVFFDRDGVLNVDHGYVHRAEEFHWVEGAQAAIRRTNDAGMLAIVVTNQAGIARGMYDEAAFQRLMGHVRRELAAVGARLDAVYHCPHHPTAACDCRKPAPGMILRAVREWGIDPGRSILVGDSATDLQAAAAAGVRAVLFSGGNVEKTLEEGGAWDPVRAP